MYAQGMYNRKKTLKLDRLIKLIYVAELMVTVIERKITFCHNDKDFLEKALVIRKNRVEKLKSIAESLV